MTFWRILGAVVATIGLIYFFLRSKQGLALMAIRASEIASESHGTDVRCVKLGVYLVSALGTSLAGALYFLGNLRISPDVAFSVNWTAFAIFLVMIGDLGTIEGPVIDAVIFWAVKKFFSDYGTWYLVGLGLMAIVVTLVFKQGMWDYLQVRFGYSFFSLQQRLELRQPYPLELFASREERSKPGFGEQETRCAEQTLLCQNVEGKKQKRRRSALWLPQQSLAFDDVAAGLPSKK